MRSIGEWKRCEWPFSGRRESAFVCKVGRGKCYLTRHDDAWLLCFSFGPDHDDSHSAMVHGTTAAEAKANAKKNIVQYFIPN